MLEIDQNVQITPNMRGRRKDSFAIEARLAAAKMNSGDSVRVENMSQRNSLRKAINLAHGRKSALTRKEGDGYRVWRVHDKYRWVEQDGHVEHRRYVAVA